VILRAVVLVGAVAMAIAPPRLVVARSGQAPLRVALAKQPLSPNGPSRGPTTMAEGGIQRSK